MDMQWNNQTEAMLKSWLDMQQQAWMPWWINTAAAANGHANDSHSGTASADQFWQTMWQQWQQQAMQNYQNVAPSLTANAQMAMEHFFAGQNQAQQLSKLVAESWQTIMAEATTPDEWQRALSTYVDTLRSQLAEAGNVSKVVENNNQLWQRYLQESQKFVQPWLQAWQQFPQQLGALATADNKATPLVAMLQLAWEAHGQTWGRMANMPSMGLTRELNETINRGFVLWQENQQVSLEYQLLLGGAMLNAFETFMQQLVAKAKAGEVVKDQKELLTLWVTVADEAFLELFHSEQYAVVQSRYVNSSMALRQQQQTLTEVGLRMVNLPTQSSLDEAHKNIFELRKEVKALKKSMATLRAAEEPTSQPAKRASTKRKSSKRTSTKRRSKAATAESGEQEQ